MARRGMLSGLGFGMGLMYFFDPDSGRRRRSFLRDKFNGIANDLAQAIEVMLQDANNRLRGLVAQTSSFLSHEEVPEAQLVERVRATLGHYVSHPRVIDVSVEDDRVILSGPVLAHEVDRLLSAVGSIRGVRGVESRLEVHDESDRIPALQGGVERLRRQTNWTPATRVAAGLIGGGLVIRAMRRPNLLNLPLGAVGFSLLTRAMGDIVAGRRGPAWQRGIDLQKAININAPREQIYDLFADPEHFPRFMTNVREVQNLGNGRWRWTVAGPAGAPIQFTAAVTLEVPSELLTWKSEPDSPIEHAGRIRLQDNPDGSTRIDLQMTYSPPAGVAGHVVASLFGSDPQSEMDEDLLRMKTYLETGKQPHDAAARQMET